LRIDGVSLLRLTLSLIHIGIGSQMENDVGVRPCNLLFARRIGEIKLRQVFEDEVLPGEDPLHGLSQLSVGAGY
jgi:hypothetical protein